MSMRVLLHVGPFNVPNSVVQQLRNACGDAEVVVTQDAKPFDQLADTEFDVLVAEEIPHNLAKWPRLRFVQLVSAGINHLQGHPVWQTDIVVANASGTHSVPIGEYVTCAVLMMTHHMPQAIVPATTRQWQRAELACSAVRGQTAGIIGYGSIGRECARQLSALGMRVMCMKRNPANRRDEGFSAWPGTGDPAGEIPERWFGPEQVREMLPLCDVLVVTVPSTTHTLGLIGTAEFALMKKSAILINVARGGIVGEVELSDALRERQLAGAVIDCFTQEPIPQDHVFFDTPNIVVTPHIAGVLDNFWTVMANLLNENMRRFAAGQPVLNRVNSTHGY